MEGVAAAGRAGALVRSDRDGRELREELYDHVEAMRGRQAVASVVCLQLRQQHFQAFIFLCSLINNCNEGASSKYSFWELDQNGWIWGKSSALRASAASNAALGARMRGLKASACPARLGVLPLKRRGHRRMMRTPSPRGKLDTSLRFCDSRCPTSLHDRNAPLAGDAGNAGRTA